MKTLKSVCFILSLFFTCVLQAQVKVNINIGAPPQWGPVGYSDVRYYYLPDVESYYDVPTAMFIYNSGGVWVHRKYLPARYRNYDLYSGYKVVMPEYRGNTPYIYYKEHKVKYAKGYRGIEQRSIGLKQANKNERKFYKGVNKNDKEFEKQMNKGNKDKWFKEKGNNRGGNGKGHGKGK